jgi:hypothetical protein
MNYMVIIASRPDELSQAVSNALEEGWSLWGNPFWAADNYCQAVARYSEPETTMKVETIAGYAVGTPG